MQEGFFLRIILRRMAHKLRKALGGTYGNCQKVPQRMVKLTETFKVWVLPPYDQLSFRMIAHNSLANSPDRHAKRLPVANQLCNGEPQLFGEIMKTIRSLLSRGQWRATKLVQDPIQIIYPDDNPIIGECPPLENPDDVSNPRRKMRYLVLENSSNNSSDSLSDPHSFPMLLLCNVLRGFGYFYGSLGDFGRFCRYRRRLTCDFAGTFGSSPCQNCHDHGRSTDYCSHYYGPCIPQNYTVTDTWLHARADSFPQLLPTTHYLIPLKTGRHSATASSRQETCND